MSDEAKKFSDEEKLEIFNWVLSVMRGTATVPQDGTEPVISWSMPIDLCGLTGNTPLEALQREMDKA